MEVKIKKNMRLQEMRQRGSELIKSENEEQRNTQLEGKRQ